MVRQTIFLVAVITFTCLMIPTLKGQKPKADTLDLNTVPFHMALATPLSTNGLQSYQTVNNASINLFYGHSAGVKGGEVGAFVNVTEHYVKGFQAGGFANITLGPIKGYQVSGFLNYGNETLEGVQMSGFANINGESVQGVQASGFVNYSGGTVSGAQTSGFINIAKRVKGTQIGFFNVAESFESGAPIGFLSFVKDGYNHLEAWGSEAFHANLSAKLGVESFYNIFSVGKQLGTHNNLWGIGYGFGSFLSLDDKWGANVDLMAYDVNKGHNINDQFSLLNTLKLNANYKIGDFEIFAGPSLNVLAVDIGGKDFESSEPIHELIGPSPLKEKTHNGTLFKGWVGANIGIRY